MRVCRNCGNKNPDGARFCKKCGNSLVMQAQQRASGGNRQQNGRPAQQRNRSSRSRNSRRESSNTGLTVVMCLVGALLAVLIIGAAILVAMHLAG